VLVSVMLGMRESHEDWLALGRDLIARGLDAPILIVADGAPGLIKAVEQCWPASDRQHCAVHRVRNLLAKLPERERERVRQEYWQALDEATTERDGHQRLQVSSTSSTKPATPPRRDAWPMTYPGRRASCATRASSERITTPTPGDTRVQYRRNARRAASSVVWVRAS
jgi:hypothetical protein